MQFISNSKNLTTIGKEELFNLGTNIGTKILNSEYLDEQQSKLKRNTIEKGTK